jgi:hypothetical protein
LSNVSYGSESAIVPAAIPGPISMRKRTSR